MVPVIDDQLHFILLCVINHLWWWALIVIPMFISFFVRGEKGAVEHVVNGPGFGQFQLVSNR
jgi:hypothetical protein